MEPLDRIRQPAIEAFGDAPAEASAIHGGDLSEVLHLLWHDGRSAIAKVGPLVDREARMLRAIRGAGAPAPAVLGIVGNVLFLEHLAQAPASALCWRALGTGLRRLHDSHAEQYGWAEDYAFGPVEIPNASMVDWPGFWAERRLLPSVPAIPPDLARRVEALCRRLGEVLPHRPAASLLHGDLWFGNVVFGRAGAAHLIDPASYHGHAEVDLAMLTLFGRPGAGFAEGYAPTEAGFATRRPIYQLWPALVHLRLFGDGYRRLVERCLAEAGH